MFLSLTLLKIKFTKMLINIRCSGVKIKSPNEAEHITERQGGSVSQSTCKFRSMLGHFYHRSMLDYDFVFRFIYASSISERNVAEILRLREMRLDFGIM